MKSMQTLLTAVVATSVIFAFAGTASARFWFSCNIDGHHHCDVNGMDIKCNAKCGPGMKSPPMGDGFLIIVSEKTQVSPKGQAFLDYLEKNGIAELKRTDVAGGPRKPSGRPETISLRPEDVRPALARFLAKIDPDWKKESLSKDKK